ncbi:HepT-like ribonuclease domain-containing protein [Gordonia sp. CPCC 205515]|uniref:HepT-like ribonuclease domain-containing protein n=1 Tax=Gordonia sp. CPCC 205515 TaxID=3140791 RepID=UPI003AF3CD00
MKVVNPYLEAARMAVDAALRSVPAAREDLIPGSDRADAILLRLQVAGEQLNRVRAEFPDEFAQHDADHWSDLIRLLNIIAHGYTQIDYDILWDILTTGLPRLRGIADVTVGYLIDGSYPCHSRQARVVSNTCSRTRCLEVPPQTRR